mgnify:CR=1 FL=1
MTIGRGPLACASNSGSSVPLLDTIIFIGSLVLLIGIVSSKLAARVGLPVLVLFLGIGMLAGEDGPGRIQFDNLSVAYAVGTLALAVIMFDGGLQTPLKALRLAWKPSLALATVGVVGTALITGLAAAWILELPLAVGALLGSIVASTDAAAVFSVLRSQGLRLRPRLAATLEIESGSNDPMAIFLTVALLQVLTNEAEPGLAQLGLLVKQMGLGTVVGLGVGWLSVRIVNGINLQTAALYPVLIGACGALAFGLAAMSGGSGFLAIYIAGIVIGNHRVVFQRGTGLFIHGLAWVAQITMFVVLGLLSSPTEVFAVVGEGLLIAAVLILVARPLAVVPLLLPFGFSAGEILLIAWGGLKGAVPIILAMFPLMVGLPQGPLLFNIVFFVVLASAVLQGWTLPLLAARLGLQEPSQPVPTVSLEISSLRDVDADIVEYTIQEQSLASETLLRDLHLPEQAVVAMIARRHELVPPRGSTRLQALDHVFIVLRPEAREEVDRIFSSGVSRSGPPAGPGQEQGPGVVQGQPEGPVDEAGLDEAVAGHEEVADEEERGAADQGGGGQPGDGAQGRQDHHADADDVGKDR